MHKDDRYAAIVNSLIAADNGFGFPMYSLSGAIKDIRESEKKEPTKGKDDGIVDDFISLVNSHNVPRIHKIIVNGIITIVIWDNGSKTIVRPMEGQQYDLEAAVSAAISKKIFRSNSAFKREIRNKVVYQESKKKKNKKKEEKNDNS